MEYRVNRRTSDKISVIGVGAAASGQGGEKECREALEYDSNGDKPQYHRYAGMHTVHVLYLSGILFHAKAIPLTFKLFRCKLPSRVGIDPHI